jgi:hypothetical protein
MAYTIHFTPKMNEQQYDEVMKRLAAAGAAAPAGRTYHACYGAGDRLRVFDVWDSTEDFERFGQTLMPILQDLGVDPGTPEIVEVRNVVRG